MNTIVTSQKDILEICKQLIKEDGVRAVTIRSVAKRAQVSVGSIYNYFPSKEALVAAAVQAVWVEIIHLSGCTEQEMDFKETMIWLFNGIKQGRDHYPNFFDYHSMGFLSHDHNGPEGSMEEFFQKIYQTMLTSLYSDSQINRDVFNEKFTPEGFVTFIFQSFMDSILRSAFDESYLITIIDKLLYPTNET